jgi:hypothetical protein
MKTFRTIGLISLCIVFLLSNTSCAVLLMPDNGKHKGWDKNKHDNSEKSKEKHKK